VLWRRPFAAESRIRPSDAGLVNRGFDMEVGDVVCVIDGSWSLERNANTGKLYSSSPACDKRRDERWIVLRIGDNLPTH